jgi:hypothetical protein
MKVNTQEREREGEREAKTFNFGVINSELTVKWKRWQYSVFARFQCYNGYV